MKTLVPEGALSSFRKEMDRFMDRFWEGEGTPSLGSWTPDIDVTETKDTLTIKAELPGIESKDLQVMLDHGLLTLRGEKRQESEHKDELLFRSERRYGSFVRSLWLPTNVDASKVKAEFKHGVLTVHLPKTTELAGKAIPILID